MKNLVLSFTLFLASINLAYSQNNAFPSSGNVGIGTLYPNSKLQIVENSQNELYGTDSAIPTSNLELQGMSSGRIPGQGPSLIFSFPANSDGTNIWAQARILATPDNVHSWNAIGRLYLQVRDYYNPGTGGSWNWRTGLMIAGNGNVGIGTTNPQNLLDVNGTIHAREIKVDLTGWSDFVFFPSYQLKPLIEVEKYIKANGHLESIPSAAEVEQNGVNVGEMQKKLLQKVEELTLYVIEKDKQLIEQMKINNEQQQLLCEMKKEIELLKKK